MTYYISPQGTPSHTSALQARDDSLLVSPYMPPGHVIQWRKNGVSIKEGSTSLAFYLGVNTAADVAAEVEGVVFDASDTGSVIDFIIDPSTSPTASLPVTLSNNSPTLSGAGVTTDSYGRSSGRPTAVWTYADADGDLQHFYRVRFGSTAGAGNYYDTGVVLSDEVFSVTIPTSTAAIPNGSTFHWKIEVGDGELIDPLDESAGLKSVAASGTGIANTPPVVSNVLVNGLSDGVIESLTPTISWTYSDIDGQPQKKFRIVVSNSGGTVWDSGLVSGTAGSQSSARYNFNLTGEALPAHSLLTVVVSVYDGIDLSSNASTTCTASSTPIITLLTVDSMVNPLTVRNLDPFFNWKYKDIDNDPLTAFEIRVADNSTDIGTDSFIGNIWHPSVVVTPESYGVLFDSDGLAFNDCGEIRELQYGTRYYFQVQIYDAFAKSEWAVGFFELNSPPTAANLAIIPTAPFNSDDLYASYDFVDATGDQESDLTQIKWYRKATGETVFTEQESLRNLRIIPGEETVPGDQWKFSVRPNDGIGFSILTYTSAPVTVVNRVPVASALAVVPAYPTTSDNLEAIFAISDPDGDSVKASISWFKNGAEQVELKNVKIIPSSVTSVDEEWYFTVVPNDGYDNGSQVQSEPVTILNTPPTIEAVAIDGEILPVAVKRANPTISWAYQDNDMEEQTKYHVIIGTQIARTRRIVTDIGSRDIGSGFTPARTSIPCGSGEGIISTADGDGTLISGDEIFDSGVIESGESLFKYATADYMQDVSMNAISFSSLSGFELLGDFQTLSLQSGQSLGTATGRFVGQTAFYNVSVTYQKEESRRSTYRLSINGSAVGQFSSVPGTGLASHTFSAIRIEAGSILGIIGIANDAGAKAKFRKLAFTPVTQLEMEAGTFSLSGYLQDGVGGIKLAGLAGTATKKFTFPTSRYNIELVYTTETSGSPVVALSLNSSVLLSFTYETGAQTRSRFLTDVPISLGDTIKISGTRNAGAAARIKKIIFRPVETIKVGAKLQAGARYFVSVRAYDGRAWSRWNTSRFVMKGSAWASNVSNARGWTIETRFKVAGELQPPEPEAETDVGEAGAV